MRKPNRIQSNRSYRRGFTLLELLVATAVTLLMMVSLARVFKIIGDSMKQGRAALQLNNTLRSVTFRLRHDLNNLTLRIDPPTDGSNGSGYMLYYDGAMTDYSSMLLDPGNGLAFPKVSTDHVRSSRFGDMDDIFMATVRAGDSWFTGKVPQFVLAGGGTDITPVTISAQHAEVAVFARPLDLNSDGLYDDSDGDGMPDGYQLYYRTLLIRPDLNLPDGALPWIASNGTNGPQLIVTSGSPVVTAMARAHQQCDLSLRRVADGTYISKGFDRVAANSLEDLMNPANRFAHVRLPIGTASVTMPLLALDSGLPILNVTSNSNPVVPLYGNESTTLGVGGGFLNAAYVLGQGPFANAARLGEDLFASDVLAFDIKGFDSAVRILGNRNETNTAGLTVANFGDGGSTDVTLTPNDAGYGRALAALPTGKSIVVGQGAYVDLLWGRKTLAALPYYGLSVSGLPAGFTTPGDYLTTELSGYGTLPSGWNGSASPNLPFTVALYKSGKVIPNGTSTPAVLQPTFDTWTTQYESDGAIQAAIAVSAEAIGRAANVQVNGFASLYNSGLTNSDIPNIFPASEAWRQTVLDPGMDGLDNNGSGGVDEITERETLAPFPGRMRGLKITVRMEDRPTRQVKQMSVAMEFVTQ